MLKEIKEDIGSLKISSGPDAGKNAMEAYKAQAKRIRDGLKN
jgi:hypothetical protein